MSTVFIVRRDAQRNAAARASLAASRLDPDLVMVDLRVEDGAALSLVRELRDRRADRPRVLLVTADAADPLLFCTIAAGADAYMLDTDMAVAPAVLQRMVRGEAALAPPLAWELLQFFGEPVSPPRDAAPVDDRSLDWHTHGSNPLKLSPGERRLAQLVAQGTRLPEVAASMAMSLEAIGRRVGNIYRKLSWDVRSGSLMMQAA